jgi:hypothetical protein
VWRTAGSGARATVRSKKKKKTAYQYGDLTFIDPVIKPLFDLVLFELKRGYTKDIDALSFVDSNTKKGPLLLEWWHKAEIERQEAGRKFTIIIFKRDRHEKCIMMSSKLFLYLEELNNTYTRPILMTTHDLGTLVILSFDQFKNWCPPESIYLLCEHLGIECSMPDNKNPKLIRRS